MAKKKDVVPVFVDNVEALEAKMQAMREAQKIFATYTQEQVDKIIYAAAVAANKMRIPLAKHADEAGAWLHGVKVFRYSDETAEAVASGEKLLKESQTVYESFADMMSPDDAAKYLDFLENGSREGLTSAELAGVEKADALLVSQKVGYEDVWDLRNAGDMLESCKKTIISTLGNEIDITPSLKHTSVNKNPGPYGEVNTSVDILDAEGNIKTRRWYDSEGKAYRDVDMSDHGNPKEHPEVPHEHTWEYNNGKPKRN